MRTAAMLLLAAGLWTPAAAMTGTLYERLGGRPAVDRIVGEAVRLYMTDPRIAGDFDNIDPAYLHAHLVDHLCTVTDGPCHYARTMAATHKGLRVDEAKFNAVAEDFQAAMERAGIGYHLQNQVMARLAPMHRDIVTR